MSHNSPLIPELQEYHRQVEAIKQDASDLMIGVTAAKFNWRPDPNRWSIAECLEHLNIIARLYFPIINQAITAARMRGWMSQGPFRYGLLGKIGKIYVRSTEPPPKMKFNSPKRFIPQHDRSILEVWPGFMVFQDRLHELISWANGVDLARVKIQIPATSLIKLSLGQCLGLVAAHERRHLWQARQVKNDPNFPE
ncbi:MAG: DinB family protein [Acidobacteria bacterium]|nr:DinB family protein [Acidobacteriota bacterium]